MKKKTLLHFYQENQGYDNFQANFPQKLPIKKLPRVTDFS